MQGGVGILQGRYGIGMPRQSIIGRKAWDSRNGARSESLFALPRQRSKTLGKAPGHLSDGNLRAYVVSAFDTGMTSHCHGQVGGIFRFDAAVKWRV